MNTNDIVLLLFKEGYNKFTALNNYKGDAYVPIKIHQQELDKALEFFMKNYTSEEK
tara:strand:+ start:995 stop:1162 length:168 start_codon:yes stop_codon:yes gene_type:complete